MKTMGIMKALRNDTVDLTQQESFGVKQGTPGATATLLGAKHTEPGRMEFLYEVDYGTRQIVVSVSTLGTRPVGVSNSDRDELKKGYTIVSSEPFKIERGIWARINPCLDHEMPNIPA